jgi:Domain of unknown function (DUF4105)
MLLHPAPAAQWRLIHFCVRSVLGCLVVCLLLWAVGAIWYDLPGPQALGKGAAIILFLVVGGLWFLGSYPWRLAAVGILAGVMGWWLTLKPSREGDWQLDVAQTASAEVCGDEVTFHHVRNAEYQTLTDFTTRWETRTVNLSKLTGVDMAINYWGSPYMAHPIISFQFSDSPPLCFSIETRKQVGQSYSAIGGLYRQYGLIYVVSDERDVIRVRTNFRKNEDLYLYRIKICPERAREWFMEYVTALNSLHENPRWYHAITTNCTTSIRSQHSEMNRQKWDWRMLLNGKCDELMYERGAFLTGGLTFEDLKKRSLINEAAHAANDASDFSSRIRANLPWFTATSR